jgi:Tol biopolymer transport system component
MCGEGEAAISCEDLFIYDRDTGTTEMLALGREQGLGADYTMGISADGRYIALGHDNNLLLYDHQTKQSQFVLTTIDEQPLNSSPFAPSLSADGRFIAFVSYASNLVADDRNEEADVFVLDRETDQIERVSVATDGSEADGESGAMPTHESVNGATDISADGRFITFPSNATNLNDQPSVMCDDYRGFTRPCYNVYLHDRATGETILISQGGDSDSLAPTLSADGQIIAFSSTATNLTADNLPACDPPGTINCSHIYRFDRQTGELILVTGAANSGAWDAQISGNGRYITFTSEATNLSPDDTNNSSDIVRYDHEAGKIERISTQPGS